MLHSFRRPAAGPLVAFTGLLTAAAGLTGAFPTSARAQITVAQGTLSRKITTAAPTGADAVRVTVLGDGSGAKLQIRLLQTGQSGTLGGFYAPPAVPIDFKGWKTFTFPLSTFVFSSLTNPDATTDGTPGLENLGANASEIQMEITAPTTRLFFDDLGWANSASDGLSGAIDTFDGASEWKATGDWEAQRSVTSGPNKIAQFVKSGTGSLQVIVRTPGLNEQQIREPALIPRLQKTPKQPFVAFNRPPFQTVTLESTPVTGENNKPLVGLTACADETEAGALSVFTTRAIKGVTVKMGAPLVRTGGGASLPSANVDIRVVRISTTDPQGPQLLLKDDRETVEGPTSRVRLTGDPICDIPQNASRRFWITVRVPAGQKPGVYTSKLVVSAPGATPLGVPFTVEVLPLAMKTAFLQYGIDYRSRLGGEAGPGETLVTPAQFTAELTDIREHGFRFVVLHDKPGPDLEAALRAYIAAGLSRTGPVVLAAPVTQADVVGLESAKANLGLPADFLFYYALPGESLRNTGAAQSYANAVRNGSRSSLLVAPIDSRGTYNTLGPALDVPVYNVSSDYAQKLIVDGKRTTSNRDWWNWNIGNQSPLENRLLAGFLLYKTGSSSSPLYGALPGPYNTAVVPVEGGVLDTVQWEAVREGIDDIRYIGILKALIRELRDLKAYKNETDLADSYLIGALSKPLTGLSPTEQQEIRRQIITRAITLQGLVTKASKGRPVASR